MNSKNPDVDLTLLMYPFGVWILYIQNPFSDFNEETQSAFLDWRIRIWILLKKCTLRF